MKKQNLLIVFFITVAFALIFDPTCTFAQKKIVPHDTGYYETFPKTVTARIFVSDKYGPFSFQAPGNVKDLEYRPNTNLNLGLGVTYNNLTLNLSTAISKNVEKGKTKGLDFQFHLYPNKLTVDLIGIFHKGYHVVPKGYASPSTNTYYYRQDMKVTHLGIAAYRVPNAAKFSYRAAFVQNEWQKKSAGSVLFGGEAYYVDFKADSAFVPKSIESGYPQKGINKINFINIGPGIGYAYTFVFGDHFFITTSLIGNVNINFTTEKSTVETKKTSVKPSAIYKGVAGYNSDSWSFTASLVGNALYARGASSPKDYFLPTGNYRFTIAKKLQKKK